MTEQPHAEDPHAAAALRAAKHIIDSAAMDMPETGPSLPTSAQLPPQVAVVVAAGEVMRQAAPRVVSDVAGEAMPQFGPLVSRIAQPRLTVARGDAMQANIKAMTSSSPTDTPQGYRGRPGQRGATLLRGTDAQAASETPIEPGNNNL